MPHVVCELTPRYSVWIKAGESWKYRGIADTLDKARLYAINDMMAYESSEYVINESHNGVKVEHYVAQREECNHA